MEYDEVVKKFGLAPQTSAQPQQGQGQQTEQSGELSYEDAISKFGIGQTPESKSVQLRSEAEAPYEQRIQQHAETAKKQVAEEGITGAFMHGLGNVPLVGPAVQSAKRYVQAYAGEGEGNTFEERKEDLKAKREAYNREVSAQHPYAETAGELVQALPMVFVPGVGWAAGAARAATLPKLGRAAATAAELAGWGAEGAAWGAGTALGEKEFGTKQPSEQKSVTEGAEEGAMFGAGIAGAGKLIGGAFSKLAPDWLAGFANKDKHAAETFMSKMHQDHLNGDLNVDPKEFASRIKGGEPVSWFDVRGPETDRWLQQKFKNNPEGLENFKASMNERLADAPERTQQFLRKMAGVEGNFDVDAVRTQARSFAEKQNAGNFAEAYQPDNGRGSWSNNWNKTLAENPDVGRAIDDVSATMSTVKGGRFENPFGTRGEMGLETTGLDKSTIETLRNNGIETLNDLKRMSKEDVANAFDLGNISTDTGRPPDVSNIYNMLKQPINGMNLSERVLLRPEAANIEFMDNLQQKINSTASRLERGATTSSEKAYVNQLKELGAKIRTSLTDESSPLYNKSFAKAHTQREMAHLTDDALTAGENFLKKINDREYIDKAANDAAKMSEEEKAFFKYGLLAQIEHAGVVGGGVQTGAPQNVALAYNKIKNWFAKPNIKRGLENALGEGGYQEMQNHLISEVFYKDAYLRARDLGARGDTFTQFLRNSWVPGLGGFVEYMAHGTPFFPVSAIMAKTANYYYGGNYARALADQLASKDPKQLAAAYQKFFNNKDMLNDVNRQLAAMAYAASVQAGETKYDSKKINQFTQDLNAVQKKAVDEAILKGMNLYKASKNVAGAAGQAAGFNQGGRVEYGDGGKTGYDWRKHYAPKDDTVGPVAPARASGYYPKEWREENRQKGFAGRARQLRNRAEYEDTPVDEIMESRTKRDDGGRTLTQPIMPTLPLPIDDPMRQQNFNAYKQDAKTLNETGDPLTVYRGERRAHPAGEMPTTKGRAVPSFATDKYVADVYAGKPFNFHGDTVNQSNVGKYHFAANNPIDLRHLGGHADLDDVFKSLPIDLSKPTALKEGKLGYNDVAKILSSLDQTVENSNAQSDTGYSHKDFRSVAREVRAHGKTPWASEEILKLLGNTRVDLYALGDNPEFVNALRRMKHDALIHKDVFEGGASRYQGDKSKLEKDKSGTVLIDAYRPLDPGVYKSSWGNKGTFNRKSKNPLESRGGPIKRSTGGRIPEADKLFKDAKKYIDSRTKGLLNEPDEKIVHALKIAKARNS